MRVAGIAALSAALSAWAIAFGTPSGLTADQIIARHMEARGGAQAWRDIKSMGWTGRIESGRVGNYGVPFMLIFKRPNSTHFEIMAQNQKSIRVFDGTAGWKLHPDDQGKPEWQTYTDDEVRFAQDAAGLDGPLFDYKDKGVGVVLKGTGTIEGHTAYGLEITLPSGQKRTDWIDAKTFLELRYDRTMRDAAGRRGLVSVYFRDYKTIQGLVLPLTIETGDVAGKLTDKMMIEKIALNPTLPDNAFSRPTVFEHRGGVVIDTTKPPTARAPTAP